MAYWEAMKPDKLHDPLLVGMPPPISAAHFDGRLAFLAILTLLLLGLFARLRRTWRNDPEYDNRADMTRLIAVVWGGLLVEWLRSRADDLTPAYWLCSLALLPFVVGAIALSLRLFRAYRTPASPKGGEDED